MPSETAKRPWALANRKTDTRPEVRLRSELHRRGFRFRKNIPIPTSGRTVVADLVFSRAMVAIFVDGCFWHCCADHGRRPHTNLAYWTPKLDRNVTRDRAVNSELRAAGWTVVRIWEHSAVVDAADEIEKVLAQCPPLLPSVS